MPPQTPLLLVDNVFDSVGLYPGAVPSAISEGAGHEAFRIADYRRDRTYWSPTSDGGGADTYVRVQLAAAHGVDSLWLDRGHNLAGRSVFLEGSSDGVTWAISQQFDVPAAGVVGGSTAAPAMCGTEEGAALSLLAAPLAARVEWRLRIPYAAGFIPIVTGVIAGLKTQLLGYSRVFDEDSGERTQVTQQSTAAYRAVDTTYAWRTAQLSLGTIGATEYDSMIRSLRALLFERNQPWVLAMDAGTHPERAWMFQYDGTRWGFAKTRVLRDGIITGREVGPRLG